LSPTCSPATQEEIELVEWTQQAHRGSLDPVMQTLHRLVTLIAALLGGSAALLNKIPVPPLCMGASVSLLLLALGVALWGIMPASGRCRLNCPAEIKAERERNIKAKTRCLQATSGHLFAAFAVAV